MVVRHWARSTPTCTKQTKGVIHGRGVAVVPKYFENGKTIGQNPKTIFFHALWGG